MKKIIVFLTTALLIISLAACGGSDENKKDDSKQVDKVEEKDNDKKLEEENDKKAKEEEEARKNSTDISVKYEDNEATSYSLEYNGLVSKITLYHKNGFVNAQSLYTDGPITAFGATTKAQVEELLRPATEGYKNVDGVIHDMIITETGVTETLTIDYDIVDLDDLAGVTGAMYDEKAKEYGIGFNVTEKQLIDLGYVKN